MNDTANPQSMLNELTDKQREVLDLLIQHKTSKEISRELGISPHTVDQRILLARTKMNVGSRNEVAQIYTRLVAGVDGGNPRIPTYGQSIYQNSDVAVLEQPGQGANRDDGADATENPAQGDIEIAAGTGSEGYYHVLPEMFDGPHGTLLRLGAMTLISILVILVGLGGLSMFAQLSTMFDR